MVTDPNMCMLLHFKSIKWSVITHTLTVCGSIYFNSPFNENNRDNIQSKPVLGITHQKILKHILWHELSIWSNARLLRSLFRPVFDQLEVIRHREIKCSSRMHSSSISSNLSFDKRYLFVGSSFHDCISCILFESLNEALWIFWRQSHNIWQPSGLYLISGLCNFCSWPEKLDVELRSEIVFRRLKCLYQDQNVNNLWKCKRRGGWKIQKD